MSNRPLLPPLGFNAYGGVVRWYAGNADESLRIVLNGTKDDFMKSGAQIIAEGEAAARVATIRAAIVLAYLYALAFIIVKWML